ncbi:MAG TPA: hypothetical protein VK943_13005 [Arenibaculum sp.]|nr:hypothetical protein [Arenibaculum sp.]
MSRLRSLKPDEPPCPFCLTAVPGHRWCSGACDLGVGEAAERLAAVHEQEDAAGTGRLLIAEHRHSRRR